MGHSVYNYLKGPRKDAKNLWHGKNKLIKSFIFFKRRSSPQFTKYISKNIFVLKPVEWFNLNQKNVYSLQIGILYVPIKLDIRKSIR